MSRIEIITVKEVERVAFIFAREYYAFNEPIPDFSTRFPNVLESCLGTPFQTFGRRSLYRGFVAKASILFYLMNKNHPFQNGNKRIAMTTLLYFLYKHKKWIEVKDQILLNFAVWIASSPPGAKEEVVKFTEKFLRKCMVPLRE